MKPANRIKIVIFIIGIVLFLFLVILFFFFDYFQDEDRDYGLNREMLGLAHKVRVYKQEHGKYPATITAVQPTDTLCVFMLYPKCTKVYYQLYNNGNNFHLAMKSFTWVYLWYDDRLCYDPDRNNFLPKLITQPTWYFCAASPNENSPHTFPVYRNDKKIFPHPEDWPVIQ